MTEYVGKICPYCKCTIREDDDVVICSECEMPHHRDCWVENQGCTTFGCTGTIQGVGNGPTSVTATTLQYETPQTGMVYCTRCGAACKPGTNFCIKCGNPMTQPAPRPAPQSQPVRPAVQYQQPANPYGQQAPRYSQPYTQHMQQQTNPYGQQAPRYSQPYTQHMQQPSNPYGQQAPRYSQPYTQHMQQPASPYGQQAPRYSQPYTQHQQPQAAAPNPYAYQTPAAQPGYNANPAPNGDDRD